ncbi:hypothetical protein [Streptomyces sp. NPDC059278]|uniref:hypothetical protein n=1 Tax=Streptomyces sp. NPDC059278 TaxID=3346801 RepID=UPI0036802DE0
MRADNVMCQWRDCRRTAIYLLFFEGEEENPMPVCWPCGTQLVEGGTRIKLLAETDWKP